MNKLVSIILPTYNGATYIARSIASVIAQSYTDWELLIVDDGSTDATADIVAPFAQQDARIRYIKNEHNLGIQKTLNKGLSLAVGEYIARIDDDDVWSDTDKLTKQIKFLQQNPEYVLVGTGVVVIDEQEKVLAKYYVPTSDTAIRKAILGKNCFVHSSVVFKKSVALSFGGYDESPQTRHVEDYDLWLKLGTVGKFANLQSYSVHFTMRPTSLSNSHKLEQFRKNILIMRRFKDVYPGYTAALIRSYARIFIYGFLIKTPLRMVFNKLLSFYKSHW